MITERPRKKNRRRINRFAYHRIYALGPERLAIVDDLLIKGVASNEVARMVQQSWQVHTDVKLFTIRKTLDRYRSDVLGPRVKAFTKKHAHSDYHSQEASRLYMQLDVLDELQQLYEAQKIRIGKGLTTEKSLGGVLLSSLRDELLAAIKMLETIADIQMETGVVKRAPKYVRGALVNEDGAMSQFLLQESTDPAVTNLINQALDIIRGGESPKALPAPDVGH